MWIFLGVMVPVGFLLGIASMSVDPIEPGTTTFQRLRRLRLSRVSTETVVARPRSNAPRPPEIAAPESGKIIAMRPRRTQARTADIRSAGRVAERRSEESSPL